MPPVQKGSVGAAVATVNNVPASVTLTPVLPAHDVGDLLLCYTSCRSGTPTVATPAGWTQLVNVAGTNGRLALFGKIATSAAEANPGCAWSGLTTGTTGTPAQAQCAVFTGTQIVVDVAGTVENGAASTTVAASGTALTTLTADDLVLALSTRLDDVGSWAAPSGFTEIGEALTTSGADMSNSWAYQVKAAPGSVAPADFALSGASSFASSGVLVALKAKTSVTHFSSFSLPITFEKSISGVVRPRYYSSFSMPIAFDSYIEGRAVKIHFGSFSLPITFASTVDGKKRIFGQISMPIIFSKDVKATKKTFGQISLPIIFGKEVVGRKKTFGQISKAFVFGATTQGRRRLFGKIDLPINLNISVGAGRVRALSRLIFPITLTIYTNAQRPAGIIPLNDAEAIYLGTQPVVAVYIEGQKVWPPT